MQLDNYLYGHKDGLTHFPKEQQQSVYENLAKVRFEDLKLLPRHYLERLSVAQLEDWLRCANYEKNGKVVAFVKKLIKKRQEKYGY